MARSIAKNTAFMTTASVGQKVVSFLYFTLLANLLDVSQIGKYFVALSFTTMFSILIDVGMSPVLTREVAKRSSQASVYLRTIMSTKVLTGILAYGIIWGTTILLGYSAELRELILVAGIVMILDSIHLSYYAVFRSLHDVRWEAIGMFGSQVLTMILGLYAVHFGLPLVSLIWVFAISSAINVVYIATMLSRKHDIRFSFTWDGSLVKKIIIMAIPFALAGVFARVSSSFDSVLLERLVGEHEAGIYSVPFKIAFAFQFIPMALIASVYPKMSEYFVSNKAKLASLFVNSTRYLLLIAFPISLGILVTSSDIISVFYGAQYHASVVPLQVLILSIIFSFASFPVGSVLNACNKQHVQTAIMGLVMVVNAGLNIALIPKYGALAAAGAATFGFALLFGVGLVMIRKIIVIPWKQLFSQTFRIIGATAIMVIVVFAVQQRVPLVIEILIGSVVYISAALFLRVTTTQELTHLFRRSSI